MREPSALRVFLGSIRARSYPRLKGVYRDPAWVLSDILLPLLATIAMVYVYEALRAPRAYLAFVVLGGAMVAFWQNVLWAMGAQFYWDRAGGNLELFTASPSPLTGILLGMAFGGILLALTRAIVIVAVSSLLFGVSYQLGGALPALGVFAVTLAAVYCLGMLMASLFLFYGRDVWHLADAMQEPVYFLSGFYFPVHTLGAYLGGAASLIPLTLGLDAIRQLVVPGTPVFIPVGWEVAAVAVQVVIYAAASQISLEVLEYRSRRDGRLIIRTS